MWVLTIFTKKRSSWMTSSYEHMDYLSKIFFEGCLHCFQIVFYTIHYCEKTPLYFLQLYLQIIVTTTEIWFLAHFQVTVTNLNIVGLIKIYKHSVITNETYYFQCTVHGGIALTSPLCHKKTDQLSNKKKSGLWSNDRRNSRCKIGIVKTLTVHAELYARVKHPS